MLRHFDGVDDWISAREAVNLVSPSVGGDQKAKNLIAHRLRDGELYVIVDWLAHAYDIGEASPFRPKVSTTKCGPSYAIWVSPRKPSPAKAPEKNVLGYAFWQGSDNWKTDLRKWQWGLGFVVVSQSGHIDDGKVSQSDPLRSAQRWMASGMKFQRAQIQSIIAPLAAIPNKPHVPGLALSGFKSDQGNAKPLRKRPTQYNYVRDLPAQHELADKGMLAIEFGPFGVDGSRGNQTKVERRIQDDFSKVGEYPDISTTRRHFHKLVAIDSAAASKSREAATLS
ncbi:MAG: hypothetical protein JWO15_1581 [Sphingomonadales bacterium]|nr:hypothetical protein [Sphingomonadales bacterium]